MIKKAIPIMIFTILILLYASFAIFGHIVFTLKLKELIGEEAFNWIINITGFH